MTHDFESFVFGFVAGVGNIELRGIQELAQKGAFAQIVREGAAELAEILQVDKGDKIRAVSKSKVTYQAEKQFDVLHPLKFGEKNGRPVIVNCSERIVEIPFVHRHLPYAYHGRVLDVGYLESELIFQVASLCFETWGIDIRPPAVEFPGIHFLQGDVIRYPLKPRSFDVVVSVSTVEHIGLQAYGNVAADPQGDVHALQAAHRALKPGGRLRVC